MNALISCLLAATALPAQEPPVRFEIDRLSLEKASDRLTLSFHAVTDLPAGAIVEVVLSPLGEAYDERARQIVRRRLEPPLRRTLQATEGAVRGKVEVAFAQPFPRAGEVAVDVHFNPDHPLQEKAAVQKRLGANLKAMKWSSVFTLGTPDLRLEPVLARWTEERGWIAEGEKIVQRLGRAAALPNEGAKAQAAAAACGDLNLFLARLEKARSGSPFPATIDYARHVFGEAGTFGSLLASGAALKRKAGDRERDAAVDGAGGKAPALEEEARVDRFLKPLARVREVMVREAALAPALELARLQGEAAAALGKGAPDPKAVRLLRESLTRGRSAAKKLHESGLSRLGGEYRALFQEPGRAEAFYDPVHERLARVLLLLDAPGGDAGALADECARGGKELAAAVQPWRSFEK